MLVTWVNEYEMPRGEGHICFREISVADARKLLVLQSPGNHHNIKDKQVAAEVQGALQWQLPHQNVWPRPNHDFLLAFSEPSTTGSGSDYRWYLVTVRHYQYF